MGEASEEEITFPGEANRISVGRKLAAAVGKVFGRARPPWRSLPYFAAFGPGRAGKVPRAKNICMGGSSKFANSSVDPR